MASSKNDSEQSSEHSKSSSEQHNTKYRLHIYDHCPYCIRVELAFGLRNFKYERVVYGYGDRLGDTSIKMLENPNTYDTGVVLTGKKELPVLEKIIQITSDNSDGMITSTTTRVWLKNESLDMIEWLEEQGGNDSKFQPRSNRDDLQEFFKTDGLFKVIQRLITRPRQMKNMTYLKDWMKVEDRQYAIAKYKSQGFDYTEAEANDKENIAKMTILLEDCNKLLTSDTSFYENGILGWDDLLYLQELRTVSLVQDDNLIWPDRLKNYVISAFAKANNVPTYFE
ncbi:hypothetical protein FRACYDRAFT_236339 [Fragilariopsis cylindrus CCMP1102]|uniref:Glutaredoxin 2 C-terminal domain-containing protein n=1 Tax=Fragilariopsis cylindrus CCMP1102 TaxID=635003 RepID=A0A1E7FQ43_9STRA|nr:hypothetical protein FRACYDRAFT_236339 [Fragilariopsis cylindrus CCMP1102]|eukprot:OEU20266.1 hypothetical protein FRACYDRAFT_236339 [Fragilariopsis cylindrus CCMP1102]